jgi:CheY-like chemotaxis protein
MDAAPLLRQLSVLYVEDDAPLREVVARTLTRRVGTLYQAGNGQEGLSLVYDRQPDMVITDIEMPVMNGLRMIEEIRKFNHVKRPIIVLTAYDDPEHHSELADGYVFKPVDMPRLFQLMEQLAVRYLGYNAPE